MNFAADEGQHREQLVHLILLVKKRRNWERAIWLATASSQVSRLTSDLHIAPPGTWLFQSQTILYPFIQHAQDVWLSLSKAANSVSAPMFTNFLYYRTIDRHHLTNTLSAQQSEYSVRTAVWNPTNKVQHQSQNRKKQPENFKEKSRNEGQSACKRTTPSKKETFCVNPPRALKVCCASGRMERFGMGVSWPAQGEEGRIAIFNEVYRAWYCSSGRFVMVELLFTRSGVESEWKKEIENPSKRAS